MDKRGRYLKILIQLFSMKIVIIMLEYGGNKTKQSSLTLSSEESVNVFVEPDSWSFISLNINMYRLFCVCVRNVNSLVKCVD